MNKAHSFKAPALLAGAMTGFTVLSGILLSASSSFAANTANLQTTVNVTAACSLTVSPSSHTATINPGTTGSIGTSTVKSICNDPAGLAVYAVGYTDDTYGNNKLTATIAGNTYDISSNYTSSGTPLSSEWYMTLTPTTGTYTPSIATGFDSAHAVPNVYTKVAYRNTMTDIGENATGAQFTAAFNAYISLAQPAGSYTGKVKFLLIHPNVLTYDSQTGEPATTQPSTLACEPPETVQYDTFDTSVTHYLQDVAQWENQVALEQEVTVYDRRDNQAYTVKRLKMSADGCDTALWMTQNLRFTGTSLSTTTSNVSSDVGSITWHSLASEGSSGGACNGSYNNGIYSGSGWSSWCKKEGVDNNGNPTVWYNYAAASAGTIADAADNTIEASSSLCPFGWRLSTMSEQSNLRNTISSDIAIFSPVSGGFYINGSLYYNTYGYWWSSTAYRGDARDSLQYANDSLDISYGSGRYIGYYIRCIAQ